MLSKIRMGDSFRGLFFNCALFLATVPLLYLVLPWFYFLCLLALIVFGSVLGLVLTFVLNPDVQHSYYPANHATTVPLLPNLPAPGTGVYRDLSETVRARGTASAPVLHPPLSAAPTVRVVTWNLERGYKLPEIIAHLRALSPDVALLQEVDMGLQRTGFVDVAAEVAAAVGLPHLYYCCEFQLANKSHGKSAPPPPKPFGCHGNAILSRLPFLSCWPHVLPCARAVTPHDLHGHLHATACARVDISALGFKAGALACWSIHLDAWFTGVDKRMQQFSHVLENVRERRLPGDLAILAGDFNTVCHGYRRLVPAFCCDSLRWGSLGYTEAQWWRQKGVLKQSEWIDPSENAVTLKIVGGLLSSDKCDWMLMSGLALAPSSTIKVDGGSNASDHNYVCMDLCSS